MNTNEKTAWNSIAQANEKTAWYSITQAIEVPGTDGAQVWEKGGSLKVDPERAVAGSRFVMIVNYAGVREAVLAAEAARGALLGVVTAYLAPGLAY
jgi:hypothetical protein